MKAAPRSLLFIPALDARKLDKGLKSGADALILDLEDSIALRVKAEARQAAAAFLAQYPQREGLPALYVRVNDLQSGLCAADLAAIIPAAPDAIMLPKANCGGDVQSLSELIDALEPRAGAQQSQTGIIVIAPETPRALLEMNSFAGCSPRLRGITWGAEDLSTALGASTNRDETGAFSAPYQLARSLCLIAARAAGVQPIDTVYPGFGDEEGIYAEAIAAARDGFTGKLAIHPAQLPAINDAFTPHEIDIIFAESVIGAFAAQGDAGVVSVEGRMLDKPHLEHARNVLARAKAAGLRELTLDGLKSTP